MLLQDEFFSVFCTLLVCRFEQFFYPVVGMGILVQYVIPAGNGDGEKMSPMSLSGDGDGEIFTPQGRGWGGWTRLGIPRCHLEVVASTPKFQGGTITSTWLPQTLAMGGRHEEC